MKNITQLATLLIFVFASNWSISQSPENLIKDFFETFESGNIEKSVENLYNSERWSAEDIDKVTTSLKYAGNTLGENYGNVKLHDTQIEDFFYQASYAIKYDMQPMRFNFQYYKADDTWILFGFSFDDELDETLEKAVEDRFLELIK